MRPPGNRPSGSETRLAESSSGCCTKIWTHLRPPCTRACRCARARRTHRPQTTRSRRDAATASAPDRRSVCGAGVLITLRRPLKKRSRATSATLAHVTAVKWLDAMTPWPRDGLGLERMRALLLAFGDPQASYPAIHVVGTNGNRTRRSRSSSCSSAKGSAWVQRSPLCRELERARST